MLSSSRKRAMDPFPQKVEVAAGMGFAVADADTNAPHAAGGLFVSHAAATEKMREAIAGNPALAGRLVILPESELVG